tara:strand:- start:559 stop:822 length:264 start_codon:yes stop_codon:yes gene_type:complete
MTEPIAMGLKHAFKDSVNPAETHVWERAHPYAKKGKRNVKFVSIISNVMMVFTATVKRPAWMGYVLQPAIRVVVANHLIAMKTHSPA